jgi:hypothetical protein
MWPCVEDDVVQDPAHVVFIISKNSYNTKPTVILHFSTPGVFWLWPTVRSKHCRRWRGRQELMLIAGRNDNAAGDNNLHIDGRQECDVSGLERYCTSVLLARPTKVGR